MVLYHAAALALCIQLQITDAEALEKAISFSDRVSRGLHDQPVGTVYSRNKIVKRAEDGTIKIEYGGRLLSIHSRTGEILSFGDMISLPDLSSLGFRRCSDAELVSLANAYWSFLGHTEPLMLGLAKLHDIEAGGIVQLGLLRTFRGVAMHPEHAVHMLITRYGGRLRLFSQDQPAPSPATLSPAITPDQAAIISEQAVRSRHPHVFALYQRVPMRLYIWHPGDARSADAETTLTPVHRATLAAGRSLLVYWAYWENLEYRPSRSGVGPTYSIFIDAITGQLIEWEYDSGAGMGGGGVAAKALKPIGWDLGVGTLTIARNGRSLTVLDGDVASVAGPAKPPAGQPVTLRRGRMSLFAQYNDSHKLLWLESGGVRRYGRPNDPLSRALRAIAVPSGSTASSGRGKEPRS